MTTTKPEKITHLRVSDQHILYVEQSGNLTGIPVVYLHGGPGAGCGPLTRGLFDPEKYHILQYDQRGCGQSTPHGSIENNTSWDLVDDLEIIRKHFGIEKWLVCGGSWGSTLALLYAQKYPTPVTGLILRGLFLGRQKEDDWLYKNGASELFPDTWEQFVGFIPKNERSNIVNAYYQRLTGNNKQLQLAAARAWCDWEMSIISLKNQEDENLTDKSCIAMATIGTHFFVNRFFLSHDNQILDDIDKIRHIPTIMVQGRYDIITPVTTAWDIKKHWPQVKLNIVPDAGHAVSEPETFKAIAEAAELFSNDLKF